MWGKCVIPRHSFIVWLALLDRLAVKTGQFKWRITENATCPLCNQQEETVERLFFKCSFSSRVWKVLLQKCSIQRAGFGWRKEVSWFTRKAIRKSGLATCRMLAFNAAKYFIWLKRNGVVFR